MYKQVIVKFLSKRGVGRGLVMLLQSLVGQVWIIQLVYTHLVLHHCYKHALVILEQYCYFLWFLHWALFSGILPYPPSFPQHKIPTTRKLFPLIFFSYEVFHTKSSQGWCMGYGMLGNKRIPLCSNNIIRKEFSVEKDERSEWFDLHEEFEQN